MGKRKEEPLQLMLLEVVMVLVVVVLPSSLRLVVEQQLLEDCTIGNPLRPIWQRKSKPWMSSWMQQCDHVMTPFAQENVGYRSEGALLLWISPLDKAITFHCKK